ncbi:MAG: KEOPS complex kinase/ATPase Bud32 [Candidatus Aenigmatarchaeota archaeon]|nr:Kae1-associated serine/threonine protein kinase [Candidatus Aenigmarchaeota archaeon]
MGKQNIFLRKGAEAIIYEEGGYLVKERVKKSYRIRQIDEKIRGLRTNLEAKLLTEARRNGVNTPCIFNVDKKKHLIKMEFIEGERAKELFERAKENEIKMISEKIGKSIARLHKADIIHGDLTTSNIIVKDNEVYFIDFGLGYFSKRIEDKGVDLKLLKDVLKSTHFKILKVCWDNILKGYKKEYKEANKVIERVKEIEKRARYAQKQE